MAVSLTTEEVTPIVYQLLRLLLLGGCVWLATKLVRIIIFTYRTHHRFTDVPHTPRHWIWGHLVSVGARLSPSINEHPDYALKEVWEEAGRPPAYFIDLAPVDRAMMIISDPRVAEEITQPTPVYKYSTPKSNTLRALTKLVGDHSLVLIEGEEWRTQRRRFNKGFAPAHLTTLVPLVLDKTRIFLDRLRNHAEKGDDFLLRDVAADLTTDVITQVAIDKDFHAQTIPEGQGAKSRFGLLTAMTTMSTLTQKVGQGLNILAYINPQKRIKELLFDRIYTKAIYDEIMHKLPSMESSNSSESKSQTTAATKAIVNLALTGLDPTPSVLEATVSQVKTFLFAGQDTTSTLIQWMAYELSKSYPSSPFYTEHYRHIRETLCAEHDEVFGASDPFSAIDVLSQEDANVDELLGPRLPYTTAFVKETLRLHPPGASARLVPMVPYDPDYPDNRDPKPYFVEIPEWTHSKTGKHYEARRVRVDGMRLYINHYILQRNPNVWGPDAAVFEPARFLDRSGKTGVDELQEAMTTTSKANGSVNGEKDHTNLPHPYHVSTLPIGSFRPFERGPRNCIGSNLAYLEAKIVLAILARGFEWQKIGLNGTKPNPGEVKYFGTGQEDVKVGAKRGWEVWNINNVTSVTVDGMKMRIKRRG